MPDGGAFLVPVWAAALTPDPDLSVSTWADEHRMLSQKASAEPGRWRTERTPYLREIMDCLSPSSAVERVVFMAGAQVGKTEAGNNWLGFIVHHAPGPAMMVQPTVEMAQRISRQRLAPMIQETPVLRERVADNKSRDAGNTLMMKEFPGGMLILTGANSASGLRSMPIRYLFADEIDAYPVDVDGEGDPLSLAEKRTTTFARRKIYVSSTPTVKDSSRIETEYLGSDQRRYFVPCPHCDHRQYLRWSSMVWSNNDPATSAYCCEACGALIGERHKTAMLAAGEWRATATGDGRTAGFHLSSLYSPLGWKSWAGIVEDFLAARQDPPKLKTWVNTALGETWEEDYANKVGSEGLAARTEFYEPGVAPEGVLVITAGVDVQDNRLAVVVRGWGVDEESWLIAHHEIHGDPEQGEVWQQLDALVLADIPHAVAEPLRIACVAVDSGAHTHAVYRYTRERRSRGVIAIKGQSQRAKAAIGKPSRVDITWRGQTMKGGGLVFPVGVDTVKTVIYARLKHTESGAGFYHWHAETTQEYFQQLTAEKQAARYVRGMKVLDWVKKAGARNEALDCEVYAYAALQWVRARYNPKTIWQSLSGKLVLRPDSGAQAAPDPEKPPARKMQRPASGAKRPNWVSKW